MARGYFNYFAKKDYLFADGIQKNVTNIAKYTAIFSRIADNASFYNVYTIKPNERLDNISEKLYQTPKYYWTIPILNADIVNIWRDIGKDTNDFENFIAAKYPGLAVTPDESTPVVGRFNPNESALIDGLEVRIVQKYATENYVHIIPIDDLPSTLTGTTMVGLDSEDSMIIQSAGPMTDAPAYFLDENDNRVISNGLLKFPVTWRDVEREKNDRDLQIKVLRPEFITDIVRKFELEMKR